ncbi:MAG TPA: sigma-70 family RNA polymerase sigma factor [Actinomycetota bacterium]|jgi:RNA polymerase sigma-70 factor (ECF subfamily)
MRPPGLPELEASSDEDLVRAFTQRRDHTALEVLLRRHEARVFAVAYRLLGNRADAADATQEVFVTVFRKARLFRHQSAFTTWLHRLTVNACHDLGRKRARTPQPHAGDPTDPGHAAGHSPSRGRRGPARESGTARDAFGQVDDRLVVEAGLAALPEEQRVPIVLRDLEGLSYQEIADAMGVPIGTVKSRIARGRMELAARLGEPAPGTQRLKDA